MWERREREWERERQARQRLMNEVHTPYCYTSAALAVCVVIFCCCCCDVLLCCVELLWWCSLVLAVILLPLLFVDGAAAVVVVVDLSECLLPCRCWKRDKNNSRGRWSPSSSSRSPSNVLTTPTLHSQDNL